MVRPRAQILVCLGRCAGAALHAAGLVFAEYPLRAHREWCVLVLFAYLGSWKGGCRAFLVCELQLEHHENSGTGTRACSWFLPSTSACLRLVVYAREVIWHKRLRTRARRLVTSSTCARVRRMGFVVPAAAVGRGGGGGAGCPPHDAGGGMGGDGKAARRARRTCGLTQRGR